MFLKTAWQGVCGFPAWKAGADEHQPQTSGLAGYDVVRIVLGLVLLVAVALKGHQLATEPVAETGLLTSRWFLIAVVEFELFFGLWLLGGLLPKWTSRVALLCFGLFAALLANAIRTEGVRGG